jgi:hypothetical protein
MLIDFGFFSKILKYIDQSESAKSIGLIGNEINVSAGIFISPSSRTDGHTLISSPDIWNIVLFITAIRPLLYFLFKRLHTSETSILIGWLILGHCIILCLEPWLWHLRKPSVWFSLTPISSLAEFTYFLRLQIVVLWVLRAPIRSRLTDIFILSIVDLRGKPLVACAMVFCLEQESRTISSAAFDAKNNCYK